MDSATTLAIARDAGYSCFALSFRYGQRHEAELDAATRVAAQAGVTAHRIIDLDLTGFGGSALTDPSLDLPQTPEAGIPISYVPARNTIFLSVALAWAEVLEAQHIFVGVNAVDYSGYPDCRPEFIEAFEAMANLATRAAVEGQHLTIEAPLLRLSKAEIIQRGLSLGVDFAATVTCYQADSEGRACGRCDACRLRAQGFAQAGETDSTRYQQPG